MEDHFIETQVVWINSRPRIITLKTPKYVPITPSMLSKISGNDRMYARDTLPEPYRHHYRNPDGGNI